MKTQKELKNEFMDIIKTEVWPNDERMIKYEKNSTAYIVELSNGDIIALEKPSIEKNFCFPYGYCGISSIEEAAAANKQAREAAKNSEYFFNENMKKVTEKIETLENCINGTAECYTYVHYYGQPKNSKLKDYSTCYLCNNPDYEPGYWSNCEGLKKLDETDIKAIINGLQEVGKDFKKRLETYLKKYGLSKIHTWSFLSD